MKTKLSPIKRVNFTFALPEGLWIERENGYKTWLSFETIIDEVGEDECRRLSTIAYAKGMCGMWYNAENGNHVFENGIEVN